MLQREDANFKTWLSMTWLTNSFKSSKNGRENRNSKELSTSELPFSLRMNVIWNRPLHLLTFNLLSYVKNLHFVRQSLGTTTTGWWGPAWSVKTFVGDTQQSALSTAPVSTSLPLIRVLHLLPVTNLKHTPMILNTTVCGPVASVTWSHLRDIMFASPYSSPASRRSPKVDHQGTPSFGRLCDRPLLPTGLVLSAAVFQPASSPHHLSEGGKGQTLNHGIHGGQWPQADVCGPARTGVWLSKRPGREEPQGFVSSVCSLADLTIWCTFAHKCASKKNKQ